ncbi:hypothetical protein M431DRAFT_465625 [Trichoderma harzianum CBS 226.95]|uniref:Uncharacterized protein n=1 Tax=Trichoderma harzianum CBS 226.95 TaxID=983964 RepID=A0A2T4A6C7_TRIHA|nr:hypothetical protein M431DRAFT_465625 [Trichoderma harzianum CBS 226.95]PTB52568.1 hypothetical protein M431DRAFT_465625 [Trichoderma harzianum CBS 226.95]
MSSSMHDMVFESVVCLIVLSRTKGRTVTYLGNEGRKCLFFFLPLFFLHSSVVSFFLCLLPGSG